MSMINKRYINNKGVILVIVLLLIIGVTLIGLLAMKISRAESGFARAYQYNRQASNAALAASIYAQKDFKNSSVNIVQAAKQDVLSIGLNGLENSDINKQAEAWKKQFGGNIFKTYFPTEIMALSGMGPSIGASTEGRLLGDLTRSTKQTAIINNLTLSSAEIPGFSKSDSYCNASANASSAAVFGSVPIIGFREEDAYDEHGNQLFDSLNKPIKIMVPERNFYLLSEVNSSIAGFKREMGTLDLGTIPCK